MVISIQLVTDSVGSLRAKLTEAETKIERLKKGDGWKETGGQHGALVHA